MSNEINQLKRQINTWQIDLEDRRAEAKADTYQVDVLQRKLKKLVASQEIDGADHSLAIGELHAQIAEIAQREEAFPAIEDELERRIDSARAEIKRHGQQSQLNELEQLKQEATPLRQRFAAAAAELATVALAERQNYARREELRNVIFEEFQAGRGVTQLPDWGNNEVSRFPWHQLGTPEAVEEARKRLAALT